MKHSDSILIRKASNAQMCVMHPTTAAAVVVYWSRHPESSLCLCAKCRNELILELNNPENSRDVLAKY
ncbi:hypothetical protein [Butyrivibrio sp.]|uniref:hypothetical protein n=1 Tax=Butyrivibrio sp. TaxID=28121 RepID=UPI0025B84834|nr:hypothetical protein [Butyrivibrio sp.]MBQ7430237.1 hypothetical protein [Butyrivibrio sp.]MBQ9303411.1 hypothetical protein [Butyrivibrio sp.]